MIRCIFYDLTGDALRPIYDIMLLVVPRVGEHFVVNSGLRKTVVDVTHFYNVEDDKHHVRLMIE